jgi:hypothetical protein
MNDNRNYLTDQLRRELDGLTAWQLLQVYAYALLNGWGRRFTVRLALAWLKVAKAI